MSPTPCCGRPDHHAKCFTSQKSALRKASIQMTSSAYCCDSSLTPVLCLDALLYLPWPVPKGTPHNRGNRSQAWGSTCIHQSSGHCHGLHWWRGAVQKGWKGSSHSNLTQSLNCLPTHLFSHFLIHSVIHSFTYAFTHSHSNSLIHLTHLFLPSFILFFTPSFIHSVTHSFIYSLICSFIHPLTL